MPWMKWPKYGVIWHFRLSTLKIAGKIGIDLEWSWTFYCLSRLIILSVHNEWSYSLRSTSMGYVSRKKAINFQII
ncbi:unnamed protein product [Hymenolepis diminuta]|uniref:Uncharacterized protein n=1 Tax=Hymenolepis diminuta TaxID=6216 RepID=A0A564YTU8_HYMDI|nr:unnamed protein product [Hymenolepis diminuta]